jgi:hypothetical protein
MRKVMGMALALAATLATGSASAEDAAGGGEKQFGSQGVVAIGIGSSSTYQYLSQGVIVPSSLTLDHSSQSSVNGFGGGSTTSFTVTPQVHYFVTDGLSVGGTVLLGYAKPDSGDSETSFGIGPTVGYNLWISPGTLSLWPQATFLFTSTGSSATFTTGTTTQTVSATTTTTAISLFVPVEIHPVKHFDFGVGPLLSTELSSSTSAGGTSADAPKTTALGIAGFIGGWL